MHVCRLLYVCVHKEQTLAWMNDGTVCIKEGLGLSERKKRKKRKEKVKPLQRESARKDDELTMKKMPMQIDNSDLGLNY